MAMAPDPELIRLGPAAANRRLVLLHGWGADAHDLLDLGALLVSPEVSVVALQAPLPHPAGVGRQWYDLQQPDWPQLPAARQALQERLMELAADIPLPATVLLGFSQGAAMALDVATSKRLPLAGLIGCSGYPHPHWQPGAAGREGPQKILLTHGEQDQVVPYAASQDLQRQLTSAGHRVEMASFSGGHTIDERLLPRMRDFIADAWAN
jgi:phospholipase/carboxylesterase